MDKKPQMMICLDASNGHCSEKNCPHYNAHKRFGRACGCVCGSGKGCGGSCIPYEPSSPKDKHCTIIGDARIPCPPSVIKGCDGCPYWKDRLIQPEPSMPLIAEGWPIDKRLHDFYAVAEHLEADGEYSRAGVIRYLIERCNRAESSTHDQQVRKAFAEQIIKTFHKINAEPDYQSGWSDAVDSCIDSIRAMAEEK